MNLSFGAKVLIANNLVSFTLWRRLSPADPLADLLSKIQALLVGFLGDKLHWLSQSVLYLPRDEEDRD